MEPARFDIARSDATVDLHDQDFYTWTLRQAELMKAGLFDRVDVKNLIEEIETLGRSEAAALESAYRLVCMHQLKRMFQRERASKSWTSTIVRERLRAARVLRDNPGLKPRREALFRSAYDDARKEAAAETDLPLRTFPEAPPFTLEEAMDEGYWAAPRAVTETDTSEGKGRSD